MINAFYFVGVLSLIAMVVGIIAPGIVRASSRRLAASRFWVLAGGAFALGNAASKDMSWWAGLATLGLFGTIAAFLLPGLRRWWRLTGLGVALATFVVGADQDANSEPARLAQVAIRRARNDSLKTIAALRSADSTALSTLRNPRASALDLFAADDHVHGRAQVPQHSHVAYAHAVLDSARHLVASGRRAADADLAGLSARLSSLAGGLTGRDEAVRVDLATRIERMQNARRSPLGRDRGPDEREIAAGPAVDCSQLRKSAEVTRWAVQQGIAADEAEEARNGPVIPGVERQFTQDEEAKIRLAIEMQLELEKMKQACR